MIIDANLPFSFVEQPSFLRFCELLNPNIALLKSDSIKRNVIKKYFEKKEILRKSFSAKGNGKVSTTTDLWTSLNSYAIMAVTATWLTAEFEMNEVILSLRELEGQHTGKNIAQAFYSVLQEFELVDKVHQ